MKLGAILNLGAAIYDLTPAELQILYEERRRYDLEIAYLNAGLSQTAKFPTWEDFYSGKKSLTAKERAKEVDALEKTFKRKLKVGNKS